MSVRPKIAFFGHFGGDNIGNESTLLAALCNLRRLLPGAEFSCICTAPGTVTSTYDIKAVASRDIDVNRSVLHNPVAKLMRKLIGVPREVRLWLRSIRTLRGTDALVVPGTGLLTDAYTLFYWGPYDTFRWSCAAKLCGCKVVFLSVGAGPIYSRAGRFFVKAALSLADFRSYRDESSVRRLKDIGFGAEDDSVYPDLVFSLPQTVKAGRNEGNTGRRVIGLGLMLYAGRYSVERPTSAVYYAYLETLVQFVDWLLVHDYDVRLLIGDLADVPVKQEFLSLLKQRLVTYEEARIIDEPVASIDDLLRQLSATDLVVATRFHNVLLALLLDKPTIAISFHHKCSSLMSQMGLSDYCQDINRLRSDELIELFCDLEKNSEKLKPLIKARAQVFRSALDEQYDRIFQLMGASCQTSMTEVSIKR